VVDELTRAARFGAAARMRRKAVDGRLRGSHDQTRSARIHRRARFEGGVAARAVRCGVGAVRINLQPWHIYVMTGAPLARLKKLAVERVAADEPWDDREFVMYPPALKSPSDGADRVR